MDLSILHEYKTKKLVKSQSHVKHDLTIWNYTDIVQFRKLWDPILLQCRGLVTNSKGEIIARPFKKFFNAGEREHSGTDDFDIYDKLDGSLGILFHYHDDWIICTRGSFTSTQAIKAQELLESKYPLYKNLDTEITYLFEIIYPENQIVVNYGNKEELIFIGAFHTQTNTEIYPITNYDPIKACNFPIAELHDFKEYDTLKTLNWKNKEGFVVRFSNGERIKIKFEQYLAIHKSVSTVTEQRLWELFKKSNDLNEFAEGIPDEFMDWVNKTWNEFNTLYDDYVQQITIEYNQYFTRNRKDFALQCMSSKYKSILLKWYDYKHHRDLIVDLFKPKAEQKKVVETFHQPSEIIILVGVSGSGKSTWANAFIEKNENYRIVSRDSLRALFFGPNDDNYYRSPCLDQKENFITKQQKSIIDNLLSNGYSVVIDNTNLKIQYIREFIKDYNHRCNLKLKYFDVSKENALINNKKRERKVKPSVIDRQFDNLIVLAKKTKFKELFANGEYFIEKSPLIPIELNSELPKALLFDLDGTLALHTGRDPFDWKSVKTDIVSKPVKYMLDLAYKDGVKVIIVTARSFEAKDSTVEWLRDNNIRYHDFYIRKRGDFRKDTTVKEEFWRDIAKTYNIVTIFDDRNQVVRHARQLGLSVFQVNDGNF